jgi:hypothetical protein
VEAIEMTTLWMRVLVVMSVVVVTTAEGQSRSAIEKMVLAYDDEERVAALQRDTVALHRLWSEAFTVNAPNNRVVIGKRAVLDAFVGSGVINFSTFDRQIEHVWHDGDVVFIMGLETVRPLSDAPAAGLRAGQVVQRRFTNIWKNEAGTWRLYARHANVIAPRPPAGSPNRP